MISRTRRGFGFTLVELLVVIAIIGVLVGLLIPAVNYARQTARKGECLNNIRGIGQALMLYESDKESFPGRTDWLRVTNEPRPIQVTWMVKLLPYLEQGNLLDQLQANTLIKPPGGGRIQIEIATCPSDQSAVDLVNDFSPLSYVVNCGVWDEDFATLKGWTNDLPENGVFHSRSLPNDVRGPNTDVKVSLGYIAKNDGATNTLLAAENLNALAWLILPGRFKGLEIQEGSHGMVWTRGSEWLLSNADSDDRQFAIDNDVARATLDSELITRPSSWVYARPSSNHSGGVNVVFCDTHARFLSDDTDPSVYYQLLTVSDTRARHPRNSSSK